MTEEQAKQRFILLNLVRFFAVGVVIAGVSNIAGKIWPAYAPTLGYVLLVFGAVDFFLAPALLKKMWRGESR